tara:strand:+ start:158 stop:478 length:321 start_codon:yes stop_codon:yes gene_type:complete
MKELIEKTSQWHHDRNLIDGATSKDQVLKLIQEVGELSDSVCKGEDVKDDIGDCLVILINIAEREGTTLEECLGVAYEDIKDRKGMMIDGIFVKEDDLIRQGLGLK